MKLHKTSSMLVVIMIFFISGCQPQIKPTPPNCPSNQNLTDAQKQKLNHLLSQKKIDPLTDYIINNTGSYQNQPRMLEQLGVERKKRCNRVKNRYLKGKKTIASFRKLQNGYRHSCPNIVKSIPKPSSNSSPRRNGSSSSKCKTIPSCKSLAMSGDTGAQFKVGQLYLKNGQKTKAYTWFTIVKSMNSKYSREAKRLRNRIKISEDEQVEAGNVAMNISKKIK